VLYIFLIKSQRPSRYQKFPLQIAHSERCFMDFPLSRSHV